MLLQQRPCFPNHLHDLRRGRLPAGRRVGQGIGLQPSLRQLTAPSRPCAASIAPWARSQLHRRRPWPLPQLSRQSSSDALGNSTHGQPRQQVRGPFVVVGHQNTGSSTSTGHADASTMVHEQFMREHPLTLSSVASIDMERHSYESDDERRADSSGEWPGNSGVHGLHGYAKANYEVLRLDKNGRARQVFARRRDLCKEHRLQPRDLRRIDPSVDVSKMPPSITIKDNVILLCLGGVRAIVTAEKALLFEPQQPASRKFLEVVLQHLQARQQGGPLVPLVPDQHRPAPEVQSHEQYMSRYYQQHKGDHAVTPPFEVEVMESALMVATGQLEAEMARATQRVQLLLTKLPRDINPVNLEELRRVKGTLVELEQKADTLRNMLEEVLDDEDELRELNLTNRPRREERRRQRERERLERELERAREIKEEIEERLEDDEQASAQAQAQSNGAPSPRTNAGTSTSFSTGGMGLGASGGSGGANGSVNGAFRHKPPSDLGGGSMNGGTINGSGGIPMVDGPGGRAGPGSVPLDRGASSGHSNGSGGETSAGGYTETTLSSEDEEGWPSDEAAYGAWAGSHADTRNGNGGNGAGPSSSHARDSGGDDGGGSGSGSAGGNGSSASWHTGHRDAHDDPWQTTGGSTPGAVAQTAPDLHPQASHYGADGLHASWHSNGSGGSSNGHATAASLQHVGPAPLAAVTAAVTAAAAVEQHHQLQEARMLELRSKFDRARLAELRARFNWGDGERERDRDRDRDARRRAAASAGDDGDVGREGWISRLEGSEEDIQEAQEALEEMVEQEEEEQEVEEVEDLIEYYLQRASATQDEAERLLAGARDLEESIGISLSARRYEVNRLELTLSIGSFSAAIGALVAGIFGMNMRSMLEMSVAGFWGVTAAILLGCCLVFATILAYTRKKRIL